MRDGRILTGHVAEGEKQESGVEKLARESRRSASPKSARSIGKLSQRGRGRGGKESRRDRKGVEGQA